MERENIPRRNRTPGPGPDCCCPASAATRECRHSPAYGARRPSVRRTIWRRAVLWRPWQFSLRSLLALTAVVALPLGWRVKQVEAQRHAAAVLRQLGGKAEF